MHSKKRLVKVIVLVTLLTTIGQAQQVSRRQQWQYCAITLVTAVFPGADPEPKTRVSATVSICYFEINGCRREEVKFDLDEADFRKSLGPNDGTTMSYFLDKASQHAMARAISKLGDDGWEMVGESPSTFAAERNNQAIYFKRQKP